MSAVIQPDNAPGRAPRPLRIAIVAHFAYGALTGGRSGHVGGVERQTTLMARWLAARGHEVTLITWDEGQADDLRIDGIRVLKTCRRDAGLPGLRFFTPRWSSLERALDRADAEVVYHNCAEYVTGQVYSWCRRRGRRFVYSIASDMDVDARLPELGKFYERWLYLYGLRGAARVIAQTGRQRDMLRDNFRRDATVLPLPCPVPGAGDAGAREPTGADCQVLWVGRIAPVKQLELLLDVAGLLPAMTFHVAGMPYEGDAYSDSMLTRARAMPNVKVHGAVERDRMNAMYCGASLLCCTSKFEGFPNTFIEAWSFGLPVVTTVDPDGLIAARGLGAHALSAADLASALATLATDTGKWRAAARAAREYYWNNHALDPALARFEQVFMQVVEQPTPAGAHPGGTIV